MKKCIKTNPQLFELYFENSKPVFETKIDMKKTIQIMISSYNINNVYNLNLIHKNLYTRKFWYFFFET